MTQISSIRSQSNRVSRREAGMPRAFEAEYCGSANATPDHNIASGLFLYDASKGKDQPIFTAVLKHPRHTDETKPRMWQEQVSKLWKCQIDTVAGTGTTQRAAWTQMWALLRITHPHLKQPEAK